MSDQQPVRARLGGHDHDLGALAEIFPSGGDPHVEHDASRGWVVLSSKLDASWGDTDALVTEADRLVVRLNAAGRLERADFEPIRGIPTFDGPGNSMQVITADSVHVRAYASVAAINGAPPPRPAARGAELVATAEQHPAFDQVMMWLGDPDLDTARMWKIYETVRMHVAGPERRGIERRFRREQWLTDSELDSFHDAINNQHVSGEAARHATHGTTSAAPISLEQAKALLIRLVKRWHQERLTS